MFCSVWQNTKADLIGSLSRSLEMTLPQNWTEGSYLDQGRQLRSGGVKELSQGFCTCDFECVFKQITMITYIECVVKERVVISSLKSSHCGIKSCILLYVHWIYCVTVWKNVSSLNSFCTIVGWNVIFWMFYETF